MQSITQRTYRIWQFRNKFLKALMLIIVFVFGEKVFLVNIIINTDCKKFTCFLNTDVFQLAFCRSYESCRCAYDTSLISGDSSHYSPIKWLGWDTGGKNDKLGSRTRDRRQGRRREAWSRDGSHGWKTRRNDARWEVTTGDEKQGRGK